MLYLIPALCAVVCTFFIARFFAAKTRLVEKEIDDIIARKLSASPLNMELLRVNEENGVMRNLLIDMVENEGSVEPAKSSRSTTEKNLLLNARMQRRREIFGEAIFVLQNTSASGKADRTVKNHGSWV